MHTDASFALKEADPLKHSQPILDEAASTDLGSMFRRRSGLAAGGYASNTNLSPIVTVGVVIRSHKSYLSAFSLNSSARRSR